MRQFNLQSSSENYLEYKRVAECRKTVRKVKRSKWREFAVASTWWGKMPTSQLWAIIKAFKNWRILSPPSLSRGKKSRDSRKDYQLNLLPLVQRASSTVLESMQFADQNHKYTNCWTAQSISMKELQ